MPKIILVSNRLPIEISVNESNYQINSSAGGLASSLQKILKNYSSSIWIGYGGNISDIRESQDIINELKTQNLISVNIDKKNYNMYYEEYSNKLIWPVFHYLIDKIPLSILGWSEYQKVNQSFAQKVIEHYESGDLIWIQDYHLFLVPKLIREKIPNAKIGFFLHIPFPSSEIFRIIPQREKIIEGLLGADLIGFHTFSYLRNFISSVMKTVNLEYFPEGFILNGSRTKASVFPISIDASEFLELSAKIEVQENTNKLLQEGRTIILGIDRMDYTKGIPRRLLSIERFFEKYPEYIGKVKFIQVGVPTRSGVETYIKYNKMVFELVGRINGKFSTSDFIPIHFLYKHISKEELVSLYKAAEIMLVTPIRDGMNLVAKEYIMSKNDLNGVLILSEYAGAVSELQESIVVNPFDIEGVADAIAFGLNMDINERQKRLKSMKDKIIGYDILKWGKLFLDELHNLDLNNSYSYNYTSPKQIIKNIENNLKSHFTIISDFDGTLVGFQDQPNNVFIDLELKELLKSISEQKHIEFHVLSGRTKEYLERTFAGLNVNLHSDHGLYSKFTGAEWVSNQVLDVSWKTELKKLLNHFTFLTPESFVEEKSASLVWHYRKSDIEISSQQLKELKIHFLQIFSNYPIKMIQGNKAIEFRMQGISKANVVSNLLSNNTNSSTFFSLGDDFSDEEIYRKHKEELYFIGIGNLIQECHFRLFNYREARDFLKELSRYIKCI